LISRVPQIETYGDQQGGIRAIMQGILGLFAFSTG
jgi:hypothetical protein